MNKIAIIGLGYVGLPLAVEFGKVRPTIGFDISSDRIKKLRVNIDPSQEIEVDELKSAKFLTFTDEKSDLADCDFFIVAVPTPVDSANVPDMSALKTATAIVGSVMKSGAVVVFESTVYPGVTEEICVPILERESGKLWKKGFNVGFSPERINPGDKIHTLTRVTKVVSGDTADILKVVAELYESVVIAGVYKASSIKVAEAAKIIENTQRDINIALMNELAVLFKKMNIDTKEVLDAAGTKWNFLKFYPGLVGGHCIGVDPYYLTYRAQQLGHHPEMILAGRRVNDSIPNFISQEFLKKYVSRGLTFDKHPILLMGLTFKEDCADVRNSKSAELVLLLKSMGFKVYAHDPLADGDEIYREYGISLCDWSDIPQVFASLLTVSHRQYLTEEYSIFDKLADGAVIFDIKSCLDEDDIAHHSYDVWRL